MRFADLADIVRAELGPHAADRLLQRICAEAAGEQVYIPSRHAPPKIEPTDTPKAVQARYKVSRTTAHNWVARWRN